MKKIILVLFCLVSPHLGASSSQQVLKNTQHLIRFVWKEILPDLLKVCVVNKSCNFSEQEQLLVEKVYSQLHLSLQNSQLVFLDSGDQFNSADTPHHRLCLTGLDVGDDIYFNNEILLKMHQQNPEAFSVLNVADVVGILLHELGHHQGLVDDHERLLDSIGVKAKTYLQNLSKTADSKSVGFPGIVIEVWNFSTAPVAGILKSSQGIFPRVLLWNNKGYIDISDDEVGYLACPAQGIEGPFVSEEISNLRWREPVRNSANNRLDFALMADSKVFCKLKDTESYDQFLRPRHIRFSTEISESGVVGALIPHLILNHPDSPEQQEPDPLDLKIVSTQSEFQESGIWKTKVDIVSGQQEPVTNLSHLPISCIAVYQVLPALPGSRWVPLSQDFHARTCQVSAQKNNSFHIVIEQDIPKASPAITLYLTELKLTIGENVSVLRFPKRPKVHYAGAGEPKYSTEVGITSRIIGGGFYSEVYIHIGSKSPPRHLQLMLGTFHSSADTYAEGFKIEYNDHVNSAGNFSQSTVEKKKNGYLVTWKIPDRELKYTPELLALFGFRIVTENYEVFSSGDTDRFEIINGRPGARGVR